MTTDPTADFNDAERTAALLDVDEELVDDIAALLEDGEQGMVLNLIADLFPADLARLLSHLPLDDARRLFHWLPSELGADVLTDLDDTFRADLLDEVHPERLTALLDELDTDLKKSVKQIDKRLVELGNSLENLSRDSNQKILKQSQDHNAELSKQIEQSRKRMDGYREELALGKVDKLALAEMLNGLAMQLNQNESGNN